MAKFYMTWPHAIGVLEMLSGITGPAFLGFIRSFWYIQFGKIFLRLREEDK
jgi:purine-cytosine permease-like protein